MTLTKTQATWLAANNLKLEYFPQSETIEITGASHCVTQVRGGFELTRKTETKIPGVRWTSGERLVSTHATLKSALAALVKAQAC